MTGRPRYGGTRLVGRRYYHRRRPVVVLTGWGPGASVRNVCIRYLDDGTEIVRPFRGLTLQPRPLLKTAGRALTEPDRQRPEERPRRRGMSAASE